MQVWAVPYCKEHAPMPQDRITTKILILREKRITQTIRLPEHSEASELRKAVSTECNLNKLAENRRNIAWKYAKKRFKTRRYYAKRTDSR